MFPSHGNQHASLRGVALPARTLSADKTGGHPRPRAPVLRAVPGLASLPVVLAALAFSPASRRGAFARLCRSLRAGARVRFAASRPCPRPRFRPFALAPSGAARWGGGFGVPSRPCPALPAPASAAPCGGGVGGSLRSPVWLFGGVSWLLCLAWSVSFRWFPWRCVRPAVGSRRGVSPLSVSRSAARGARCPGSWRSRGFPRSPPRRASRCRGVGGFPPAPAFARCARWPVGLRCRFPFARACRRAGRACAPWWPLVPLSASLPPLPVRVAHWPGCRWRWLSRGGSRCLAVRCPSRAVAALLCRRARAFGLPPLVAGRRGLLVLLPVARPRGPSALSLRLAGPLAFTAPPSLSGVPLPVSPRGGRSRSPAPARPRRVSFAQGRLF